jgi:hypothetical protein
MLREFIVFPGHEAWFESNLIGDLRGSLSQPLVDLEIYFGLS